MRHISGCGMIQIFARFIADAITTETLDRLLVTHSETIAASRTRTPARSKGPQLASKFFDHLQVEYWTVTLPAFLTSAFLNPRADWCEIRTGGIGALYLLFVLDWFTTRSIFVTALLRGAWARCLHRGFLRAKGQDP